MLNKTVPILPSTDVEQTAAFFIEKLGFTVANPTDGYIVAERDEAEIHFALSRLPASLGTGCYIVGDDVVPLYEEFSGRGLEIDPPVAQPWGLTELTVVDPDGNLLRFASFTQEEAPG